MLNKPTYFPGLGQKPRGRAVIRNRRGQSRQIQWPTHLGAQAPRWILQIGISLVLALEVYPAVALAAPTGHSTNGPLIILGASGYRASDSGGLTGMGSNGNYWSYASNSQAYAYNLNFNSGNVNPLNNNNRSNGFSVRPARAFDNAGKCVFIHMKYTYDDIHALVMQGYLDARENERNTNAQLAFELHLEENIGDHARALQARTWRPGPMDWFVNLDPTVREIFCWRNYVDGVTSHILLNILGPIFERYFIFDSYSCRKEKGTLFGIERFEHHLRGVTDNYTLDACVLNLDISGFFMAIVRSRLYEIIHDTLERYRARFPEAIDYEFTDYLVSAYIAHNPLDGCRYLGDPALIPLVQPNKSIRDREPGVGLPIGDVNNQLNANVYLTPFDWFVKRSLQIRHYCRYVDDARLLHRDYNYLLRCKDECGEFLDRELCLKLHPTKTTITSAYETNYFLGGAILPHRRYAQNATITRFRQYVSDLETRLQTGGVDLRAEISNINSRLGYLKHFQTYKIVTSALDAAPNVRRAFDFTSSYSKAIIKKQSII